MSACVVLAWCILPIVAVLGSREPGHPAAQANISIASSTQLVLTSESVSVKTAKATAAPAEPVATWTVRPGDTLSAIAAALSVPGGWQALYAANRSAIGPDPAAISPGTVLITSRPVSLEQAFAKPQARHKNQAAPPRTVLPPASGQPARPARQAPNTGAPPSAGRQPNGRVAAPGNRLAPGHFTIPAGGMPRWLEDVLLAAGVLAATAFAAEPAAALTRRRKASRPARPRAPGSAPQLARRAAKKARIILANHERLIVTYSTSDHTVYVLTPPGEDPSAVLRAARLILPENTYEDLADHLGIPPNWPQE